MHRSVSKIEGGRGQHSERHTLIVRKGSQIVHECSLTEDYGKVIKPDEVVLVVASCSSCSKRERFPRLVHSDVMTNHYVSSVLMNNSNHPATCLGGMPEVATAIQ
jgi:hypothetical protein